MLNRKGNFSEMLPVIIGLMVLLLIAAGVWAIRVKPGIKSIESVVPVNLASQEEQNMINFIKASITGERYDEARTLIQDFKKKYPKSKAYAELSYLGDFYINYHFARQGQQTPKVSEYHSGFSKFLDSLRDHFEKKESRDAYASFMSLQSGDSQTSQLNRLFYGLVVEPEKYSSDQYIAQISKLLENPLSKDTVLLYPGFEKELSSKENPYDSRVYGAEAELLFLLALEHAGLKNKVSSIISDEKFMNMRRISRYNTLDQHNTVTLIYIYLFDRKFISEQSYWNLENNYKGDGSYAAVKQAFFITYPKEYNEERNAEAYNKQLEDEQRRIRAQTNDVG